MSHTFPVDWKLAPRESDIEAQIMQYLALRHIPAFQTHGVHRLPGGGVRVVRPHRKGVPDIVGCLPWSGRMFQIEVKDDDGIVTEEQQAVMREFRRARALVFVARSVEDVQQAIEAERQRKR